MKLGYIIKHNLEMNPQLTERFTFKEAPFTRCISTRGDRVSCKMLCCPIDYDEIVGNANIMHNHPQLILVQEPFLLDDELRERVTKWVEWANKTDQSEYDPFARAEKETSHADDHD